MTAVSLTFVYSFYLLNNWYKSMPFPLSPIFLLYIFHLKVILFLVGSEVLCIQASGSLLLHFYLYMLEMRYGSLVSPDLTTTSSLWPKAAYDLLTSLSGCLVQLC